MLSKEGGVWRGGGRQRKGEKKSFEGDIDGVRGWSGEVPGTVDSKKSFRSRRAGGHSPYPAGPPRETLGSLVTRHGDRRRSWKGTWGPSVSARGPPSAAQAALVTCAAVALTHKASGFAGIPKPEPPCIPRTPRSQSWIHKAH